MSLNLTLTAILPDGKEVNINIPQTSTVFTKHIIDNFPLNSLEPVFGKLVEWTIDNISNKKKVNEIQGIINKLKKEKGNIDLIASGDLIAYYQNVLDEESGQNYINSIKSEIEKYPDARWEWSYL